MGERQSWHLAYFVERFRIGDRERDPASSQTYWTPLGLAATGVLPFLILPAEADLRMAAGPLGDPLPDAYLEVIAGRGDQGRG